MIARIGLTAKPLDIGASHDGQRYGRVNPVGRKYKQKAPPKPGQVPWRS
jgi:hypothetical protein